jgi:hypothetical protein
MAQWRNGCYCEHFLPAPREGDNTVNYNGGVGDDFRVTSQNGNDTVKIADTVMIDENQERALREQNENHSYGGCGSEQLVGTRREFGELRLNGRQLGFFFRAAGR